MKTEEIKEIKEILTWAIPAERKHFLKEVGWNSKKITEDEFKRLLTEEEETFCFEAELDESSLMCFFKAEREFTEEEVAEEDKLFDEKYALIEEIENTEEEYEKVYMDQLDPVDGLFHCEVVSHGLAAYSDGDPIEKLQKIMEGIEVGYMQLCAAHKSQKIGAVGVYLMGHVHCVSNVDLYSEKENNGIKSRFILEDNLDKLIYTKEEIDLTKWSHMEYIVTPKKIVGIWYKEEIDKIILKQLKEIAAKLKIKIYKVK